MLYESGMLLISKSVEKYPKLSERLIEYLYQLVCNFDDSRIEEFMISVQRVLLSCERHKIVGKISDIINNSKLSTEIQKKLKKLYTADQLIQHRKNQ